MAGVDLDGGRKLRVVADARVCANIHIMEIFIFCPMVERQALAVVGWCILPVFFAVFATILFFGYCLRRKADVILFSGVCC